MEITYHWEGDYLIPDLKLSDTIEYQIGKYGRMRKRFLEENHRGIYSYMLLSETLWKHLAEIDEECNEMMDRLVRQMAKNEGVTEQLKSDDWLLWIQKTNSIRSRAEEIVLHDLIYSIYFCGTPAGGSRKRRRCQDIGSASPAAVLTSSALPAMG